MKYIVTERKEDGLEEIWVFPRHVNHDDFAEIVSYVKQQKGFNDWYKPYRKPISAGFISENFTCYGGSQTLNLDTRAKDTELLHSQ